MKKMNDKPINLHWYEVFISLMIIMSSQIFNNAFVMIIFGIFLMFYAFFAKPEKTFYIMMLLIPSAENLKMYGSTTIPIAMMASFFIYYILNIIKNKKIERVNWYIFSIILMIYCILTFSMVSSKEPIMMTIKCILFLSFIRSAFSSYEISNARYSDIYVKSMEYMGIGLIFASILEIFFGGHSSLSERFSFGQNSTINVIGIQCAIVIVGLTYAYLIKASSKVKDLIIIGLCLFIAILTMSKTAILMIAIGFLLLIFCGFIRGKNFRAIIIFTILTVTFGCLYTYNGTIHNYVEKILSRFQADDLSNGRYYLWEQTIDIMNKNKKYFYFGAGDYEKIGAVAGKNRVVLPAHNFILETWVAYGTIGIIFVFFQYFSFIKNTIPYNRFKKLFRYDNWISFVPIIVVLNGFFYSHHFIGRPNTIIFILSFLPIIMLREQEMRYKNV